MLGTITCILSLQAAENRITLFKNQQAEEFKQCMIAVEDVRNECSRIFKLAQDSISSHQIKSFILKLQLFTKKQLEVVEKVGNACKDSYDGFEEKFRISNYLYLRSIR